MVCRYVFPIAVFIIVFVSNFPINQNGSEYLWKGLLYDGILFVFLIAITVGIVEYFVPLNMKFEMNSMCRGTLFATEIQGGLTDQEKTNIQNLLTGKGFQIPPCIGCFRKVYSNN